MTRWSCRPRVQLVVVGIGMVDGRGARVRASFDKMKRHVANTGA